MDKALNRAKNFALVTFDSMEDCKHAKFNMDQSEFFGVVIEVKFARALKLIKEQGHNKAIWEVEEVEAKIEETEDVPQI